MRDTTLLFLIKKSAEKKYSTNIGGIDGKVEEICLAMKKRGFGVGRWNGVGGKCGPGESVEDAAIREAFEEIGVNVRKGDSGSGDLKKMAELEFLFADPDKVGWNQLVHVFVVERWEGEPTESEEMRPQWFKVKDIPFAQMWPDDPFWLPKVINGNFVKASFTFGDGDAILKQKVEVGPLSMLKYHYD